MGGVTRGGEAATYAIPSADLYPRDETHRFRIYARHGDDLDVLACCEVDALGATLLQLDADESENGGRLVDRGALGVLDAVRGRWLILPWHRPELPTTFGALPTRVTGAA